MYTLYSNCMCIAFAHLPCEAVSCANAGLFYYLDTAVYKIIHLLRVAIYMYAASTETQQ